MIRIECPLCETRFDLDGVALSPTRKLKCSKCGHVFLAEQGRVDEESESPQDLDSDDQPLRLTSSSRQSDTASNDLEEAPEPPTAESMADAIPNAIPDAIPDAIPAPYPQSAKAGDAPTAGNRSTPDEQPDIEAVPGEEPNEECLINPKTAKSRIHHARRKSNKWSVVWLISLSVVAIGSGVYAFYFLNQQGIFSSAKGAPPESETVASNNKSVETGMPADGDPEGAMNQPESPSQIETPSQTTETGDDANAPTLQQLVGDKNDLDPFAGEPKSDSPLLTQGSSAWPKSEMRSQWNRIYPRLVRLIADTPNGKREAMGVVVDSRGWVATSLRAVAGSSSIEVRQIRSHNELFDNKEFLVDKVRGVIETDPALDLALLSVNRKFVISLDQVRFPEKDTLVGSQRMLVPFFPQLYSRAVVREMLLDNRKSFQQWDADLQARLQAVGLTEGDMKWIPLREKLANEKDQPTLQPESICAGAPLYNKEGELVGITTNLRLATRPIAVSSVHLATMLKVSKGQTKPLSVLNSELEKIGIQTVDAQTVVKDKNPLKKVTIRLNQTGSDCDTFGWQPTSAGQYDLLCRLLETTVQLESFASRQNDNRYEPEKLRDQTNYWLKKMDEALGENFASVDTNRFNGFAKSKIADHQSFFFAYAKVAFTAFDGPKLEGEDAVTFQLLGTGEFLTVPFDPKMPKLLPDSIWLLACQPSRREPMNFADNGVQQTATITRLIFASGPLTK